MATSVLVRDKEENGDTCLDPGYLRAQVSKPTHCATSGYLLKLMVSSRAFPREVCSLMNAQG